MAEPFLQELGPTFISRPATEDIGYDLLVGFLNKRGGINTFAVKVNIYQTSAEHAISAPADCTLDRFAHSNIPGLLLVADVKQNRMYHAWLTSRDLTGSGSVSIPLSGVGMMRRKTSFA